MARRSINDLFMAAACHLEPGVCSADDLFPAQAVMGWKSIVNEP